MSHTGQSLPRPLSNLLAPPVVQWRHYSTCMTSFDAFMPSGRDLAAALTLSRVTRHVTALRTFSFIDEKPVLPPNGRAFFIERWCSRHNIEPNNTPIKRNYKRGIKTLNVGSMEQPQRAGAQHEKIDYYPVYVFCLKNKTGAYTPCRTVEEKTCLQYSMYGLTISNFWTCIIKCTHFPIMWQSFTTIGRGTSENAWLKK